METDSDGGRFDESYRDNEFLEALRERGGQAGSGDVAEIVGCSRRTATRRLSALAKAGKVSRGNVGNATLWSVADTPHAE